jgi:glycosyltransferase involved in cell wall biosynthesis
MSNSRTLWCDVTSLLRHVGAVSGIQRALSGLVTGLLAEAGDRRLAFCHFNRRRAFTAMPREELDDVLANLGNTWEVPSQIAERWRAFGERFARPEFASPFAPGDVLLNAGFATYKPKQQPATSELLARSGVRYVGMVYDLLPVTFPEWWTVLQQERFGAWFRWSGRNAALLLCCSESTRRDALAYFASEQIETGRVETVLLADELPKRLIAARGAVPSATPTSGPPFVLYVSTLEVRKNHRLLFQIWKRLCAKHGRDAIPDLVLVGRRGWLIDDFLTEAENAHWLDGKIVWRERVDDDELVQLYAGCLFTVYPSLYEGWGLPVAEALAFGKYCVASGASSLPEVGRDFIDYHDPYDVAGATALVERAIFDPAYREQRERTIREQYRVRTWRTSAAEVLALIDRHCAAPPRHAQAASAKSSAR